MIENRVLDLDDYLAIGRRHLKLIAFAALGATALGFAISFAFSAQYTSSSLVLVERQTIPAGYVKPIVTTSLVDRIVALEQRVLSRSQLEAMVRRLGLAKEGEVDEVVSSIQRNVTFTDAEPSASSPSASSSGSSSIFRKGSDFVGFNVRFTANNPQDAQRICAEITSMVLAENSKMREQVAVSTTDFLTRQLAEAKSSLDEKDQELAAFKGRYLGQLPTDVENNTRILSGLNAELDANTQSLNRAQQDKSYAESLLAQQVGVWNSAQTSATEETIGQRLVALRTQLVTLKARYTADYPDVIKTKNDIAALEAQQKEMDRSKGGESKNEEIASIGPKSKAESAQILQLRERVHQDDAAIARASGEEQRLQKLIDSYQSRLTLSPQVEKQYEQLTRDNEVAHKLYDTLLINKSESEIQTDLERSQQGEQLRLLDPASLPDSPSFPVRWKFSGAGLAGGLAVGLAIAFWFELRDRTIRDERDVLAALELPTLGSLVWVDHRAEGQPGGVRRRVKTLLGT